MATLTVAAVRARVAAVVEALASPSAWTESRWVWDVLPMMEPGQWAQLHFAVGVAESTWGAIESSRTNRGSDGGMTHTTVVVRWLYRLRADAAVADYDLMLAAEQTLITALCGTAQTDLHLRLAAARRTTAGDGTWSLGDLTLDAIHRIAIQ